MTRPNVEEVYAYRKHIDKEMIRLINTSNNQEITDLVILGIHHEQQHQELLFTDVKYMFGHNPLHPVYDESSSFLAIDDGPTSSFLAIGEGVYDIGYEGDGFCYDNELGRHKVFLHSYEISSDLVTNQDYLEFIEDGGYQDFNLWLDEGWTWVEANQIQAPLYWFQKDKQWHQYTMAGLLPLQPLQPLQHVSFYEAAAYAEWKGLRLPTEFEWEVAADQLNWGKRWEWTNSAYLPYPNFEKAPGALGEYNGKFMINQMVLRGASVATSPGHSRKTYRNFFHADARWQYTGIRLAKSV